MLEMFYKKNSRPFAEIIRSFEFAIVVIVSP